MQEDFLFNTAHDFSTALLKIIEIWPGQQNYKKKKGKLSQKKVYV
jgi:hypothetical protein